MHATWISHLASERHPPVIRSKHRAPAKARSRTFPPLQRGARGGEGRHPPVIRSPRTSPHIRSRPPHVLRRHPFPRRPTRIGPSVHSPGTQPRQSLPRLLLRTLTNPLPPPDFLPRVPSLVVRQGTCNRLCCRTSTSTRLRTPHRNWLRLQNWLRLTIVKSRNTAGIRRNFNNILMLCYARVITKIGFVRRFFTDLTLVAACGNLFFPPSISSFRQLLLSDFARTSRIQFDVAPLGFLQFCTHRFRVRYFILQGSPRRRLAVAVARSANVLLRKIPTTRQNVRFLDHNRLPPAPLLIRSSRHTPCAVRLRLTANLNRRARTTTREWPAAPTVTRIRLPIRVLGAGLLAPPSPRPQVSLLPTPHTLRPPSRRPPIIWADNIFPRHRRQSLRIAIRLPRPYLLPNYLAPSLHRPLGARTIAASPQLPWYKQIPCVASSAQVHP